MPKMKTKSGAKKRFKKTGSGRVKIRRSHRSHILTKKSTKRKRHLRAPAAVRECDVERVSRMMPYA